MKDGIKSLNPLGLSPIWVPNKSQLISRAAKTNNSSMGTSTDAHNKVRRIESTDKVVEKDEEIIGDEFKKLVDFYV